MLSSESVSLFLIVQIYFAIGHPSACRSDHKQEFNIYLAVCLTLELSTRMNKGQYRNQSSYHEYRHWFACHNSSLLLVASVEPPSPHPSDTYKLCNSVGTYGSDPAIIPSQMPAQQGH